MGFLGDLFGGLAGGLGSMVGFIPGVGNAVAGISNILGGALSGAQSKASQAADNAESRAWQSAENEKSRAFNAEQAQIDRDFQEKMWNMQNAYNTPEQIVKRMSAAGINPAAAFRQGAGATGVSSSLPGGAAASSTPGSPVFPFSPTQAAMESQSVRGAYLKSLTSAFKDLSAAGVDRASIEKIWQDISSSISQQRLTDLQAEQQDMVNKIYALTGRKKAMLEVDNLLADLYVKTENLRYISSMTANERLKRFEIYWNGFNAKYRALMGKNDYKKSHILLEWLPAQLKAGLENTQADTYEKKTRGELNAATASLHAELAKTEYAFRPIREYLLNDEHNLNVRTIDSRVNEWKAKASEAEQKAFLEAVKAQDIKSYNAFQRVLLGKGSSDDKKAIIDLLRGLSDADKLSGAAPVYK